jgi:hypothetical protein
MSQRGVRDVVHRAAFAMLVSFLVVRAAPAHHSFQPYFDLTRQVEIKGRVKRFDFRNPHSRLVLMARDPSGRPAEWVCEMSGAAYLRRHGWTEALFRPGDPVTVRGFPARHERRGCGFVSARLKDGSIVGRSEMFEDEYEAADAHPPPRPARLADGQPNFSGPWYKPIPVKVEDILERQRNRPASAPAPNPDLRYITNLTPAGRAAIANYDPFKDDPALHCRAASIVRAWEAPEGASELEQRTDRILVRHEYMDVRRTIWLTDSDEAMRAAEAPSPFGFSRGRYEGDTLVVETTRFTPGLLFGRPGVPTSAALRIVERIHLDDEARLINAWLVEDPLYFKEPVAGRHDWRRTTRPLAATYACVPLGAEPEVTEHALGDGFRIALLLATLAMLAVVHLASRPPLVEVSSGRGSRDHGVGRAP